MNSAKREAWRFGTSRKAIGKGLLFAHMGWLFSEEQATVDQYAPDIRDDKDLQRVNNAFPIIVVMTFLLPGIIGGFTLTVVSLIGASAMAGAVGAGGLGDIAIRYGYQRFDTTVMAVVIVVLIGLVSLVQWVGDVSVRRLKAR